MTINPRSATRRTLLATSGSITLAALAGCLGGDDDGDENGDDDDENGNGGDDDDNGEEADSLEVGEFELLDRDHDDAVIAYVHGDHWDHGPLVVPVDDYVSVGAHVEDGDGHEIELGDDITLEAEVADGENEIVDIDSHGDHLSVAGEEEGFTGLVFQLVENDTVVYETTADHPLEVEVGDGEQDHVDEDDDDDH